MWDVFISHAAEDKEAVARPLAEALSRAGYRVWYDEFTLRLGDSLNRSIDRGLAQSRYGLVVLSPHFLAKEWPRRELDGLSVREVAAGKVILPVWHGVTQAQVQAFSPILADRLGVDTGRGLDHVVQAVLQVLKGQAQAPLDGAPATMPRVAVPPRTTVPGWSRRRWLAAGGALGGLGTLLLAVRQWQVRRDANAFAGRWVIDPVGAIPRTYLELNVSSGQLSGTVETLYPNDPGSVLSGLYAQRKTALVEGKLAPPLIAFAARRRIRTSWTDAQQLSDLVVRYEGRLESDVLRLAMQVEGGVHADVTARRVAADESTARIEQTLRGHESQVTQLTLLDGQTLASSSADKTVRLWSLESGREIRQLLHGSGVLAFLPLPGQRLVGFGDEGGIWEWDLSKSEALRGSLQLDDKLVDVLPLGNGQVLLAYGWYQQQLALYEPGSGRIARKWALQGQRTERFAMSGNSTLAGGDADGALRLWSLEPSREIRLVRPGRAGTGNSVTGLQALPDGRLVYTVYDEPTPFLFDPSRDQPVALPLLRSAQRVRLVARLGDELVFIDDVYDLVLWHAPSSRARRILNLEREDWALTAIQRLPDGRLALGMGNGEIKLWRPA